MKKVHIQKTGKAVIDFVQYRKPLHKITIFKRLFTYAYSLGREKGCLCPKEAFWQEPSTLEQINAFWAYKNIQREARTRKLGFTKTVARF